MTPDNFAMGIPKLTINEALTLLISVADRLTKAGKQGIFLWGPPGIGKSDLVKELSVKTNRELVDIRLSTIDPVDLRGLPSIDTQKELTKWLPPDFLPQHKNKSGILFLDEINAAPPTIQAAAYQLILDKKLGNYVVPKNWIVIAAGNRLGDRSVTYRIPSALANRFSHFEIVTDNEQWYAWAWKNQIDPFIISFIRHQPQLLLQFDPESPDLAFPTPRSWAFASSMQDLRNIDLNLYIKGLHGTVGSGAAQQFLAFLKHKDSLPDPEKVLNGEKYNYPNSPDAQYVMIASLIPALIKKPTNERIGNYFNYAKYYDNTQFADYSVILVKELISAIDAYDNEKEDSEKLKMILTNNESFKEWIKSHIDVLV